MLITRWLLLDAILLVCSAVPAIGQPIDVGQTSFPLGELAFPDGSACLDPTGCGSEDFSVHDSTHPLKPPVSPAAALLGHRLDLVALDLDGTDEMQLSFPVPIANLPGDDLYVAQALFIGELGDAQGINDLEIRFGATATWHVVSLTTFVEDESVLVFVTYSDPELKQDAYYPRIATLDLSDFGFAAGATVQQLVIRGSVNLGSSGLDLAVVGNLNEAPAAVPALSSLGVGTLAALLLCAGRWAQASWHAAQQGAAVR
jgi:hypothetical protein